MAGMYKNAKYCSDKCRSAASRGSIRAHALSSFRLAEVRGAHIEPNFTVDFLEGMIKDRGDCYLCRATTAGEFHIDHIVPIARGGWHSASNLGFLCKACNLDKGARNLADYVSGVLALDLPRLARIADRYRQEEAA